LALADKELYLRIGRPQNACVQCGAAIDAAGTHPSALLDPDGPDTSPRADVELRRDYCAACWQQFCGGHYMGFWMARREPPKPRKIRTRKERNAALLSYFEVLRERHAGDEDHAQCLYFLAHLLMKYSVFKWVKSTAATSEAPEKIYFRNTTTDEIVEIEACELHDARIAELKRELDDYLSQAVSHENVAPPQPVAAS
jgi:hypothetical protein